MTQIPVHSPKIKDTFHLAPPRMVGIFKISGQAQDVYHIFWAVCTEFPICFLGGGGGGGGGGKQPPPPPPQKNIHDCGVLLQKFLIFFWGGGGGGVNGKHPPLMLPKESSHSH